METVLFGLRQVWFLGFPVIWLGGLATMVWLARGQRRHGDAWVKPRFMVFFVAMATFILGCAVIARRTKHLVDTRVQHLFVGPHRAVLFLAPRAAKLSKPADIAELVALLRSGRDVAAHHSHPEHEITFRFADDPRVFSLGRDSAEANEYWLKLDSSPVGGEQGIPKLRQFQSPELTAWLSRQPFEEIPKSAR
jgi:hypothetical protein